MHLCQSHVPIVKDWEWQKHLGRPVWGDTHFSDVQIWLSALLKFLELHCRLRLSLPRFPSFPLSSMSIRPMSRSEHSPSLFWVSIFLQMTFFSKWLTCLYLSNIYLSEDPNYCKECQEAVSKMGSGTKSLTVGPGECYSEERRARRVACTRYTSSLMISQRWPGKISLEREIPL